MIVLVDDNEQVRRATAGLLRSLGYRTATFASAEEFMRSTQLHKTSCLITDVQMPGMTGIELQARLKAQGHRIPVIVMTAFPDDSVRDRAMQNGASGFLTKPFTMESLTVCLLRALGHQRTAPGSAGDHARPTAAHERG
jgi:FixJ family two-component response regulator